MCVPYVYVEMVGMQLVNRLFNTQTMHMAFRRTYQVNSIHNPFLANPTLLHLTSSILHPLVPFKAHTNISTTGLQHFPVLLFLLGRTDWNFHPKFISNGLK